MSLYIVCTCGNFGDVSGGNVFNATINLSSCTARVNKPIGTELPTMNQGCDATHNGAPHYAHSCTSAWLGRRGRGMGRAHPGAHGWWPALLLQADLEWWAAVRMTAGITLATWLRPAVTLGQAMRKAASLVLPTSEHGASRRASKRFPEEIFGQVLPWSVTGEKVPLSTTPGKLMVSMGLISSLFKLFGVGQLGFKDSVIRFWLLDLKA